MFEAFYKSDIQGVWLLCALPLSFLVWLVIAETPRVGGVEPRATAFIRGWAIVFSIETLIDPLATGPLLRWLGVADAPWAIGVLLPFVLLGDFRVFVLVFFVAEPERGVSSAVGRAALWTLVVPLIAWTGNALLEAALDGVPGQVLWLVYELAFLAMALFLRGRWVPEHARTSATAGYLRMLASYVAAYYFLWASADVLILSGIDAGWALRVIPNQLYYAFWVPIVWFAFFASRYASTRSSVQASR